MDRISEHPTEACSNLSTSGTRTAGTQGSKHASLLPGSSRSPEIKRSYPPILTDRKSSGTEAEEWWRTTVVYEVYVRSFCDSTGNGVGDLTGIRSKLDYLVSLGVGTLWLSPFYPSPMLDFGYDISNFVDVDPAFGTLSDFKALIRSMKAKGLRLVLDFVPNHTSDQHVWFQKSVRKVLPYTDYYVWKPGKGLDEDGKPIPPNNWVGVFGGSMWEWSPEREEFYLHQFTAAQPDLNYDNSVVIEEMLGVLKFWLDLGVDGFRVDSLPHLYEDPELRDQVPAEIKVGSRGPVLTPAEYGYWDHEYTSNLPQTLDVLEKFRALCDSYKDRDGGTRIIMSEGYLSVEDVMKYYSTRERNRAHFPFNFELIGSLDAGFKGSDLFRVVANWMDNLPLPSSCPNWLIGNHDQARVGTRLGPGLIDAMNMIVLLLPGVGISYYGEEIGMTDTVISWEQTVDPSGIMAGEDKYRRYSRDPERTPMQWNDTSLAGFSCGKKSWLPLNPNYKTVNAESQLEADQSHLKVYKALVGLRQWEAFKGGLEIRLLNQGAVLAFTRRGADENVPGLIVVVNFGNVSVDVDLTCFPSIPKYLGFLIQSVPDSGDEKKNDLRNAVIEATKVHLLSKQGLVLAFSTERVE